MRFKFFSFVVISKNVTLSVTAVPKYVGLLISPLGILVAFEIPLSFTKYEVVERCN